MTATTSNAEHPYTPARAAQGLVFASGALSVDDHGRPVAGRRAALDAALRNVAARLATEDARLEDVVKLTYYVTDLSLRNEANEQLVSSWPERRPARTFVEVSRLPYDALVEIDAIAAR